jgi:hypothetical protein
VVVWSITYRGIGHTVSDDNILAAPVLRAAETSYSASTAATAAAGSSSSKTSGVLNAGTDVLLVSAVQAR